MKQCLFGEHLLSDTSATMSAKPVAIVESEKTALVAAMFIPDFVWLVRPGKVATAVSNKRGHCK